MFDGYDPKTYFQSEETNDRVLLIKNDVLPIAPSYKLDADNFFFLQYDMNGRVITEKIEQKENGIIFNNSLFAQGIPAKVLFCYQTKTPSGPRSSILATFIPVVADIADIKQQVQLIIKYSGSTDKKKLKEYVTGQIFDDYGKIGPAEVDKLME